MHNIEWYDTDISNSLKMGFTIIQDGCRSEKYMQEFTRLINENIDKCSTILRLAELGVYPRSFLCSEIQQERVMKQEFTKYMANIEHYPFQMYIHWQPAEVGASFYSDRSFEISWSA
ncbi:MAG: hypothetical protein ACLTCP_09530 [Ruminococcus bicirculans (ex Wegman et al. 2014)]